MSITWEFTGRPQRAINNILGEGGVNLVSAQGLVMNKTELRHIIDWSGIQSQIQMRMCMLASISIVFPTKDFPTVLLLHAARSFINDAPQMAIQRAVTRPREIPLWIFQCCLLGQFAKMLRFVGCDLETSLCCAFQISIAYIPAKLRSQVSRLNQHILSIFCFRVASISEQCAACLWFERMVMILERMPTFGFVTFSHGGVSRNHLKILDVDQTQGSNQKRCTTMFHSPRFKERGESRYTESWQSYCSYSERLSSDHMDLLTNRIAQITCKSYTSTHLHR